MNGSLVLGVAGLLISATTAGGVLYRGWRQRVQDAAKKPFQAGQEAVNEAETALRLKDQRLADSAAHATELAGQLEQAKATNAAQQGQITSLYVTIGELQSENAQLKRDGAVARSRIGDLEKTMKELQEKFGSGAGA